MNRPRHRLLLTFYNFILLLLSVLGIVVSLNRYPEAEQVVSEWIGEFYREPSLRWPLLILSTLVLILTLRHIWGVVYRQPDSHGVDRLTELGHIQISLQTLEALATKAAQQVSGIRQLTARVRQDSHTSSVGIGLKLTVDGETPIQALSEQLQSTVKKNVEEISGVGVHQISVYIADIVQPERTPIRVD
ncbi:alkaline shock response membrane anchor protein AmaP [Marininema halotolerans]|uniref:Uncharacterized conserved protein YloU, alkaline shock protein (Asp23) family n=1 Tax=Marininema halotolerans TaxID=1155944 RepID=A0A1I6TVX8_9BACL|nr:alkaline shock response membrane anchor protein AmaP [Marininema halotolerans]SFS93147.1 Uncharacterized conserved protein YloU, alkaline shock protein (Asp23) family [Marininema halotolerans]